jgi:hypothetical protein
LPAIITLTPIGTRTERRAKSMRRRRGAALTDAAGVYHVASRLAYEGFHAALARGGASRASRADVFASLPAASATAAALLVRTTECSPKRRGDRGEGGARRCEWRVGKEAALANDPALFVALVDLGGTEGLPAVHLFPSAKVHEHFASGEPRRWRYALPEELKARKDNWGILDRPRPEPPGVRVQRKWQKARRGTGRPVGRPRAGDQAA